MPWFEQVGLPVLLRHGRTTYGLAMRNALGEAGYEDIPRNGLYVISGLAAGAGSVPLGQLIQELGVSKQAAGQLVDTLVLRGYLERTVDPADRRKLTVGLTERGQGAAAIIDAMARKIDKELFDLVGATNLQSTRRTLAALIKIGQAYRENVGADH